MSELDLKIFSSRRRNEGPQRRTFAQTQAVLCSTCWKAVTSNHAAARRVVRSALSKASRSKQGS